MSRLRLVVLLTTSCFASSHALVAAAQPLPVPESSASVPAASAVPVAPPAPYYGYGYGYSYASDARLRALHELQLLDQRIAQLRRGQQQHSIVGPIIMTAAGYSFTVVLGALALVNASIARDINKGHCGDDEPYDFDSACDFNNDGDVDHHDEADARRLARILGGVSLIGAGLGITGTVLLVRRLAKRRAFAPELRELGVRRGQLLQQLRYGGVFTSNALQLNVSGRF